MIHEHCTRTAIICPKHRLTFLTDDQYNEQLGKANSLWLCPICDAPSKWSDKVYEIEECAYCKKILTSGLFIYDSGINKGFCHVKCRQCYDGKCTVPGCTHDAKISIWTEFPIGAELHQFIVPVILCATHKADLPLKKLKAELYNDIVEMLQGEEGVEIPDIKDFKIIFKKVKNET